MRISALAVPLLLLAAGASADGGRKIRYFASYDYFLPGTSGDGLRDFNTAFAGNLNAAGFTNIDSRVQKKGGVGFRAGGMYQVDPHAFLGASLGYVVGPNVASQLSAVNPGVGTGSMSINEDVVLLRALIETSLRFPLGRRFSFNLGTGWGIAYGKVEQTCDASGQIVCPAASASRTWTGIAYDFAPGISYRLDRSEIGLTLRYMAIPRYTGTDSIAPLDWKTFGVSLGATF